MPPSYTLMCLLSLVDKCLMSERRGSGNARLSVTLGTNDISKSTNNPLEVDLLPSIHPITTELILNNTHLDIKQLCKALASTCMSIQFYNGYSLEISHMRAEIFRHSCFETG